MKNRLAQALFWSLIIFFILAGLKKLNARMPGLFLSQREEVVLEILRAEKQKAMKKENLQ